MDNIEKIKSGTFKDYFANAVFSGIIFTLIFFLLNLIENDFFTSLYRGFITSCTIVILLFTIGYFHEEWFIRRKTIKLLKSDKFLGLQYIGLTLNNELDYVGYIDNYFARFITIEKWTKRKTETRHSIDLYCNPTDFDKLSILIDKVKNIKEVRNAAWGYGIFTVYFNSDTQHFDKLTIAIINLLKDHQVQTLNMTSWENSFGNELRMTMSELGNQQTKQLVKIGKLDIRYKKP